jgi:tRNA G46 methylase TrmB
MLCKAAYIMPDHTFGICCWQTAQQHNQTLPRNLQQIMKLVTCLFTIVLQRCPAFTLHPEHRISSILADTMYTINDEVCPPTDRNLLKDLIYRSCSSIDNFLERKPIAAHTRAAFEDIKEFIDPSKNIVLDSGCGTARSTVLLGEMHPDKQVIGVDRSFVRLNKNARLNNEHILPIEESIRPFQAVSSNVILVRAELADFWRCCIHEDWYISHHYLLYPNPYPTKARIKQRWYGHPTFPLILQLGGEIMVRSNWEGFLKEFAQSVEYANEYLLESCQVNNYASPYLKDAQIGPTERINKSRAWTNFEKKYDDIGENTYELLLRPTRDLSAIR